MYGVDRIVERHRHRFEFNNKYREALKAAGLVVSGLNPERDLVEIVELPNHPWFVGCQFHPEFKSRPNRPHPLFAGLVGAAIALRIGRPNRSKARHKAVQDKQGKAFTCKNGSYG